jgi:quinohemoprotein amine dehydrogenase
MAGFAKGKFYPGGCLTLVFAATLTLIPTLASSQSAPLKAADSPEEGIPVTDPLVVAKCGACHVQDEKGNLSRISSIRTTPEGWEEAIKRMIRLNGVSLEPDEARHVLKYLSDTHGIAPAEAQMVENYAEHRMVDETFPPDPDVRHACAACHAMARPLSWHRTPEDWKLLVNMHIAFFPSVNGISFQPETRRRAPEGEASDAGKDTRPPVDKALEYILKTSPFHSAAWSEWQASMGTPRLAGEWLIAGEEPGKGKFFGKMAIAPGSSAGMFTTKTKLKYVDGSSLKLSEEGSSIVYTGFQWRGRSTPQQAGTSPADPKTVREVMLVSSDQSTMTGRWFWGIYEEFGMDVKLRRSRVGPTVLGTDVSSLKAGTSGDKVTIYGDHLPQEIGSSDIDFGAGVKVANILSKSPDALTVSVDVAADATPGMRTITVGDVASPDALAVYKQVDFIKVTPVESLAHLGSETHPKGYVQFEAVAYSFGPDGKPNTADDIKLGPMPATWKLEEFYSTLGDDDVNYVGTIDAKTGLFTPASDGPSPPRKSMRNNYGDVWAVATVTPEGASAPMVGKSYLVVTVPMYMIFDQPEVGQ